MQYSFSILLFGLLAALALAAPSKPSTIQKRSFKVNRVRSTTFKGRNGPKQLYKAYSKYKMPVPAALMDAINNQQQAAAAAPVSLATKGKGAISNVTRPAGNGTGVVVNKPEDLDVEYIIPIVIGNQTVLVDPDSGSADLWVFSTQLPAAAQANRAVFNPAKSTTFQAMQGATFTISYGDGSGAKGNVGTDVVTVGGVSVPNQTVELATAVSSSFVEDTGSSGLLGLCFSVLNTVTPQKQTTWFENVMPSLAEPVFTADLRHNAPGAYEFGRVDTTKFTGPMTWVPVNPANGFWQFSTSGYAVGTNAKTTVKTAQAIADTGTTLLLVSPEVSSAYYAKIPGAKNDAEQGGMTIPCKSTLPDLMLDVGGVYMAKVKGSDINFAPIDQAGNSTFLLPPSIVSLGDRLVLTGPWLLTRRSVLWWCATHNIQPPDLGRHLFQVAVRRFQRRQQIAWHGAACVKMDGFSPAILCLSA